MPYLLRYHPDARTRLRIKSAMEKRLISQPEKYGSPLRRDLRGYWKLRVGDNRVGFRVAGDEVILFAIIHRKDVHLIEAKRG